jgi:hypothetical protein
MGVERPDQRGAAGESREKRVRSAPAARDRRGSSAPQRTQYSTVDQ